jgi:CRP/FNR family transcriptional regulator, dissimilatory nitrate respiration regulator
MRTNTSDLPAPDIASVRPTLRRLAAGTSLFHRGDATFGIFFLAAGRLRLQRVTLDGNATTLHAPRPGETFAEASLFADRYHCDAVADTDCEVWIYPKDALTKRLRNDPASLWDYAGGLARSLQNMRQRYELKQIRSAPARVLQLLRLRCDESGVYRTSGALKELAADLGLTHESLYRALAVLEREERIERTDQALRVTGMRTAATKTPSQ